MAKSYLVYAEGVFSLRMNQCFSCDQVYGLSDYNSLLFKFSPNENIVFLDNILYLNK